MPFTRKQNASLETANSTPAMVGPIIRAALYMPELKAIALGRSCRSGTISGRNDWRIGESMAMITPEQRCRHDDVPNLDASEPGERGEGERGDSRGRLHHDEELLAVHPVGPQSAEGREHEHRDLAGEGGHAEQPRRARQAVDQPRHRDLLHPVADDAQRLAVEEQPVIAVVERARE